MMLHCYNQILTIKSPREFSVEVAKNPAIVKYVPYRGWRFRFENGVMFHEKLPLWERIKLFLGHGTDHDA